MKSATAYLLIVLLVCAVGSAAVSEFYFLKKTPEPSVSAAAAIPPSQINRTAFVYQSELLDISVAPNEPVRVADTKIEKTGDIIIEAENISSQPVTFIGYYLAPAVCPESVKPAALWIAYGNRSASSGNEEHKTDSPIAPNGKAMLRVSQKAYKGILDFQKSAKCSGSAKPELRLSRVVFNDRSEWEGFADGIGHSEWNGRFLAPKQSK